MKRSHKVLLLVGLALVALGICLPLASMLAPRGEPAEVPPSLWIAFWGLAIGIPLSAIGCFLAALAVVLSRFGRQRPPDDRASSRRA